MTAALGPARMPGRIRAVLFDLEGTLVDLRDYAGWSEEAAKLGLTVDPEAFAHWYRESLERNDRAPGQGAPESGFWRDVLEGAAGAPVSNEQATEFFAAVLRRGVSVHLYSDVRRCLDRLREQGRRLAVISNNRRSDAYVWEILDRAGISAYFDQVLSSSTEGVAKPNPEIFHRAVRRMSVEPTDACFVGDLPNTDAKGAEAAGLAGVWLHRGGTGFGDDPPEITSLIELPRWVESVERGRALLPQARGLNTESES